MKKTLLVMVSEIGRTLRRKAFTIFSLGLPILMGIVVLVLGFVNRDAGAATLPTEPETPALKEQVGEGYVDEGELIEVLPDGIPSGWLTEYADQTAAQAALDEGEISAFYVIPANYVQSGEIIYVKPEYGLIEENLNTEGIAWVLLVNLLGGDTELAGNLWNPFEEQVTQLASPSGEQAEDNLFTDLLPTLMTVILYMAIILPSGVLVTAVLDVKKNRVLEVLMSSVSPLQMITGKILALGLLGLLQVALWVSVLWMTTRLGGQPLGIPAGFELPTQLLVWSFVYFILGYAMYGGLLAGVGALAPEVKDTKGASVLVMSPLIAVYVFVIVLVTQPESVLAMVLSLFPLTAPVGMIARMTVMEVPAWQPVLAAVLQLLTAIFIVRSVARLFRAQHLLSGQTFNVNRFLRALTGRV